MNEAEHKREDKERRFSEEQYQMLLRCSEKKDIREWNEWRTKYDKDIWLEGADLRGAYLQGVDLVDAKLFNARLEGANLQDAKLQNAIFLAATVDGATLIWKPEVNWYHRKGWLFTDFSGVALDSVRIDPPTKQLLEYNIRRKYWEKWYREKDWYKISSKEKRNAFGKFIRWPVQLFWAMSDYGMSTLRVVGVFFLLAFLFAGIYMNLAYWRPPGIVSNLGVQPEIGEAAWHYFGRALVRPVYFSIVTMTTLGFGDMYANKGSIAGHVILCVQVILGYVLLGALITRFAVLFTAGGPAGKFAKQKKKVDSVSGDNGIRGQALRQAQDGQVRNDNEMI